MKSAPASGPSPTAAARAQARPGDRKIPEQARRSGGGEAVDEDWTPSELAAVREQLMGDAQRIRAEMASSAAVIHELLEAGDANAGDDPADSVGRTSGREQEMLLADVHRLALEQTERAVQRIDEGTYGRCESCAGPVGKARMAAFPRATLCLRCKQIQERH